MRVHLTIDVPEMAAAGRARQLRSLLLTFGRQGVAAAVDPLGRDRVERWTGADDPYRSFAALSAARPGHRAGGAPRVVGGAGAPAASPALRRVEHSYAEYAMRTVLAWRTAKQGQPRGPAGCRRESYN